MPALVNALGPLLFNVWRGRPPELYREQVQRVNRAGIDGSLFRLVGKNSGPFQLQSTRDTTNPMGELALYPPLLEQGALQLVWRNYNYYTNEGLAVKVLDVQTADVRAVRSYVNGFNLFPTHLVTANWTLEFVIPTVGA